MNNLLRTLTESQVKSAYPDSDLKLLLNAVKDGRRQSYDTKLSDAFYDSLEGLLNDLRTVTIDNRDAEPFLKPVAKAEAHDYYDVIANPMDFGTMMKKVKSKQYKSKREFKDDLDLIWSNCYTYNAAENHPLRQCVKRLKVKADRLLKYITDRKERADPPIPSNLVVTHVARPKINGHAALNGRTHSHKRTPSFPSTIVKSGMPSTKLPTPVPVTKLMSDANAHFPDTPAITRTREGMALFLQLDRDIMQASEHKLNMDTRPIFEKLREVTSPVEDSSEPESDVQTPDSNAGDKRKANGFVDHRPHKRARRTLQCAIPATFDKSETSEVWWSAVQSDALLANGLPNIPYSTSSSTASTFRQQRTHPPDSKPLLKPKRRKKPPPDQPKSLLTAMNNNIKTMKRLRHTHARFAALNLNGSGNDDPDGAGGGEGAGYGGRGATPTMAVGMEEDAIGVVDDKVDERPWSVPRRGKRKIGGIELGEKNAMDCVEWMSGKVLEHAGFQGTSQVALDVLAGVASEYLFNVGRTIKYLCDAYSSRMTPEEIILHTLFESGTSKIQDLERYISDDVERYGARLSELEKKLVNAYRETTAAEVLDEEGLFDEEDEEAGALAMGDFADALGEDYLGLRELGIAAEFGMTSLSIPKKLLKGKKGQNKPAAAKPIEPPPPYPPPPPFVPLSSADLDDQIELLKPYYESRFAALASAFAVPPPHPGLVPKGTPSPPIATDTSVPQIPSSQPYGNSPYPPVNDPSPQIPPPAPSSPTSMPLVLPDDPPNSAQAKMGPIGQILKAGPATTGGKKKKGAVANVGVGGPAGGGGIGTEVTALSKKKKAGMVGVGTGNGRKKKAAEGNGEVPPPAVPLPGVVTAAPMQMIPSLGQ